MEHCSGVSWHTYATSLDNERYRKGDCWKASAIAFSAVAVGSALTVGSAFAVAAVGVALASWGMGVYYNASTRINVELQNLKVFSNCEVHGAVGVGVISDELFRMPQIRNLEITRQMRKASSRLRRLTAW